MHKKEIIGNKMEQSNRIQQKVEEIQKYIDECKSKRRRPSSEIIVNREILDNLVSELNVLIPDETRRYQRIFDNKEAILNDAREKAQALIDQAAIQASEVINEHEIMQQAYEQANEVVNMASAQAQEIVDNATIEANELKEAAVQYMDDILADIETTITSAIQTVSENYENLMNELNGYKNIIQRNRSELYPTEEYPEEENTEGLLTETEENINTDTETPPN